MTPLEATAVASPLKGLLGPCVRAAFVVAALTGLAYPLSTTGVAQLLLSHQAEGGLVRLGGTLVGAQGIGQAFSNPEHFHPRPSATSAPDRKEPGKSVDSPYNAMASSGSNLGPTSQALIDAVRGRVAEYRRINGLDAKAPVPVDAVTASASGLDPHISVANAQAQAARVANARGLPLDQVQRLVDEHIEGRTFGLLGVPRVNVLRLNLALQALAGAQPAAPAAKH